MELLMISCVTQFIHYVYKQFWLERKFENCLVDCKKVCNFAAVFQNYVN